MKKTLMIALGLVAAGLFADEIAWPADFWDKVNARLTDVDSNHASASSGKTVDALDTTFTTSFAKAWLNDFFSWAWSEDESVGTAVDFTPTGSVILIRLLKGVRNDKQDDIGGGSVWRVHGVRGAAGLERRGHAGCERPRDDFVRSFGDGDCDLRA